MDTANIAEIREGAEFGVVSGVTTNPSLAAKEGIGGRDSYRAAVQEIADIIDGPISVEVVSADAPGMIAEGRDIAEWIPNPWVKIPSTPEGFKAISVLARDGIKINQTLCFSVNQALLGAQAGSTVISPFVGRLDDIGQEGMALVQEIVSIYRQHGDFHPGNGRQHSSHPALHPGRPGRSQYFHIPFGVLKQMAQHPLTDAGLSRFLQDWEKAATRNRRS